MRMKASRVTHLRLAREGLLREYEAPISEQQPHHVSLDASAALPFKGLASIPNRTHPGVNTSPRTP